jgi:CheY-like chemotaxis protein
MKKILYVEDDEMSRGVISTRLRRSGFDVVVQEDGYKALESVKIETFDLFILDMNMPGLSGWDLAKKFRADPLTSAIPILALTAHTMSTDRKKALDAGCSDFDSKPVNLPRLLGKINALLGVATPSDAS